MDYEKKYKDALERARKIKHDVQNIGCKMDSDMLDLIFPELAESEDERIRKELITAIDEGRVFDIDKEVADRWIAWLEKQKDKNCLACDQHLKGYLAGRKVTEEEKQKEQKPAEKSEIPTNSEKPNNQWSEEDENMIWNIISIVGHSKSLQAEEIMDWLKSLRPHWKPSEEQMSALLAVLNDPNNIGAETCQLALEELYEHLKAL